VGGEQEGGKQQGAGSASAQQGWEYVAMQVQEIGAEGGGLQAVV
jgi:hypothetical protein